jgi:hypothetical protein
VKHVSPFAVAVALTMVTPAWSSDFQDTQFGYTVSSPDFPRPAVGSGLVRVFIAAPSEDGFSANMNVTVQEKVTTLEDYIVDSQKGFGALGMTLRSATRREVSKRPAVLFDYEGTQAGRPLHFLSLAVILPERVLLVTYTAPVSSFSTYEPEFRRSADSFKLDPR